MALILIKEGPATGQELKIDADLVLGRENADLTIDDIELSRQHARIKPVDGALEIEDLGSLNGTWVNGNRIPGSTRLEPGDTVKVGKTVIEVLADPVIEAPPPPPEPVIAPPPPPEPVIEVPPPPPEPVVEPPPPPEPVIQPPPPPEPVIQPPPPEPVIEAPPPSEPVIEPPPEPVIEAPADSFPKKLEDETYVQKTFVGLPEELGGARGATPVDEPLPPVERIQPRERPQAPEDDWLRPYPISPPPPDDERTIVPEPPAPPDHERTIAPQPASPERERTVVPESAPWQPQPPVDVPAAPPPPWQEPPPAEPSPPTPPAWQETPAARAPFLEAPPAPPAEPPPAVPQPPVAEPAPERVAARRAARPASVWNLERVAALCGIPFVALTLAANALPGSTPLRGAAPQKFLEFFADNQAKITAAFFLITLAVFFFFPYLGILWRTFRSAEGDHAWLSTVLIAAATATAAISVADNAFWAAAALRARQDLSPALARTLFDLGSIFYMPWLTLSVFLAAAAALIFRTGVFGRWLGWLAAISAPLVLLTGMRGHGGVVSYFVLAGHAGLIAWAFWTLATSIILVRRLGATAAEQRR